MSSRRSAKPDWTSVKDLFGGKNNFQFVIPVYQRDYVWEEKQVNKLLEDYENLLGNTSEHFLGIIIYHFVYRGDKTDQKFVIDGQQRLTTLFILIHTIYERAIKQGKTDLADKLADCIYPNTSKPEKGLKLDPIMNKSDVFNKLMSGNSESLTNEEKETRLNQAYENIQSFVNDDLCDYEIQELSDALDRLMIVDIPLEKEDNAQQIFESINALGSPLNQADLIRNFVLMKCPEEVKKEHYNDYWLPFENKFNDTKEFDSFFRYFIQAQRGDFVNKRLVYDEFSTWFNEELARNNNVAAILLLLTKYADTYNDLYYSDLKNYDKNGLWHTIRDFRNIKSTMPVPFALEIMRFYKENKINGDQLREILDVLNTFIVRRAIIGKDTSGITRFFCTLLKNVRILIKDDYSKLVDAVKYLVIDHNSDKASSCPTDNDLKASLAMQNTYDYKDALHFFFDKYENEKQQVDSFTNTMGLQIEHIMPQEGAKWLKIVNLSKDEYETQKNRLGNLTLVTKHDNPKLSNDLFEYKKVILKDTSHYRLNVDVYNNPKWDKDEIDKRNEALITEFIRLYPYSRSSYVSEFDAILEEIRRSSKPITSRIAYIKKIWPLVNEIIEEKGTFEQKENNVRPYFNFICGRPYHYYIDLFSIKDGLINFGIWFSNSKNMNFDLFCKHIDDINDGKFKYTIYCGDNQKRGNICASIPIMKLDDDAFPSFIRDIVNEIYRLHDITSDYYTESTSENIEFVSPKDGKTYCTDLLEDKLVIVEKISKLKPDNDEEIIDDYLNNINLIPENGLQAKIKQIINYEIGLIKTKNWVIPCNPQYYDVDKSFAKNGAIQWKQRSSKIEIGSYVYIYVGMPIKQLVYKAVVEKVGLPNATLDDTDCLLSDDTESRDGPFIEIKLVHKFSDGDLPCDLIKENGFGSPQGWSRVSQKLYNLIESKIKK